MSQMRQHQLCFNLKPLQNRSSKYVKPVVEQVNFKIDFSLLTEIQAGIPNKANEAWKNISDAMEFVSFTDLYERIESCQKEANILSAFDPDNDTYEKSLLTIELTRHLSYLCRIIPVSVFRKFFSKTSLDAVSLMSSLGQNEQICLNCAIQLLHSIVKKEEIKYDQKMMIVKKFAYLLIPSKLLEKRKNRSYMTFLAFIPVDGNDGVKQWLCIHKNLNNLRTYLRNGKNDVLSNFTLDQLKPKVNGNQLLFYPKNMSNPQPLLTFDFITEGAVKFWESIIEKKNNDPLLCFVSCFPHIVQFIDELPEDFNEQLAKIIQANDMDLAQALTTVGSTGGSDTKIGIETILNMLQEAGTFSNFFRAAYANSAENSVSSSTIFRENSAASNCSSLIFQLFGSQYSNGIVYTLYSKYPNLEDAIYAVLNYDMPLPSSLNFLFSCVFRAARRKYPDQLTPLYAVNSIMMLRFLLPRLSSISRQASQFGQRILNAFVFRQVKEDPLPESLYRKIAYHTCNISHVKICNKLQFQNTDIKNILKYFGNKEILIDTLTGVLKKENQLVWGVLEFLENIFVGVDENYENLMAKSKLF